MQELRIENDNTGFDKPAIVRNVSDMLSSAFKHVPKILKSNLNLIIIMSIAALILAGVMDYAVNYFWAETISRKINEIVGSGAGNYNEVLRMALKGAKKFILAYAYLLIMMPLFYLCLYYIFYSYIKKSEAFSGMKMRSFIKYIVMLIVNNYVMWMFISIILMIPVVIIIVIMSLFSLLPGIGPFVIPFIQIFMQLGSIIIQFLLMPFISQGVILSVFRKIYPIRCIKLSFLIPFKSCGNKRGGLFGGNYWRIVLVNLIAAIVFSVGFGLVAVILYIIGALIPDRSVFGYISTGIIFSVTLLVRLLFSTYTFSLQTAYTIENLYFGNYPYLEEIKNASAE